MSEKTQVVHGVQNTGNPVLDSTVNVYMASGAAHGAIKSIHALLLELAKQEPGGLKTTCTDPVERPPQRKRLSAKQMADGPS